MVRYTKKSATIATDLMFAPLVMAMRLPIMASETQKGGLPTETLLAATEKMSAYTEGLFAAQMAYARAAWSFWPELMTGRRPSLFSTATTERAVQAALTPSSRRVKSNFRRLASK